MVIFDNFDLQSSHVLPAMLRKFHEAKLKNHSNVTLWGSGTPMREFLFVDDLADAVVYSLENRLPEHLYNVGTGKDITIMELAEIIQKITGHQRKNYLGFIKTRRNAKKIDGCFKNERYWLEYKTELKEGIKKTYSWFVDNLANIKEVKM